MRCHASGAGCGTSGRGHTTTSRGGSRRKTGWAHYQDALRSETRRRQIAEDAAWRAARRDWGVANGSPHGAYRRAIPLDSGDGKKKRIRANPRARIKTGAALARACSGEVGTG